MERDEGWTGRKVALFVTAWFTACMMAAYIIVPSSVLPLIIDDLTVGPAAASGLVSGLFLAEVVCGIPAGIVLDRVDNRRVLAGATAVVLVAMAWGWQAAAGGAYLGLLASRVVAGVGAITIWTGLVNVIGGAFGPERQGTAIAAFAASFPAGFAVGQATGPLIALRAGWPAVFPVFGALMAVGFAAFWVASRGFGAVGGEVPSAADFGRVLTNRAVLSVSVASFAAFSVYLVVNNWVPKYITETFDTSLSSGGFLVAAFVAVGIVGRSVSGVISDRWFGGRRRPVILASFLVTTPAVVAIPFAGNVAVVAAALIVSGLFLQFGMGVFLAYVRELVDENVASTALAVLNVTGFFGAFSAPIVTGAFIERTGSYLPAFAYAGVLGLLGLLLTVATPERRT